MLKLFIDKISINLRYIIAISVFCLFGLLVGYRLEEKFKIYSSKRDVSFTNDYFDYDEINLNKLINKFFINTTMREKFAAAFIAHLDSFKSDPAYASDVQTIKNKFLHLFIKDDQVNARALGEFFKNNVLDSNQRIKRTGIKIVGGGNDSYELNCQLSAPKICYLASLAFIKAWNDTVAVFNKLQNVKIQQQFERFDALTREYSNIVSGVSNNKREMEVELDSLLTQAASLVVENSNIAIEPVQGVFQASFDKTYHYSVILEKIRYAIASSKNLNQKGKEHALEQLSKASTSLEKYKLEYFINNSVKAARQEEVVARIKSFEKMFESKYELPIAEVVEDNFSFSNAAESLSPAPNVILIISTLLSLMIPLVTIVFYKILTGKNAA